MTDYKNSLFSPETGKKLNSKNEVVNTADAYDVTVGASSVILEDVSNRSVLATSLGQLRVALLDNQIANSFAYPLEAGGIITDVTGSGEVVQENSSLVLRTTTADGTASIETLQSLRYPPGSQAQLQGTVAQLPVGEEYASCKARIGNFDNEDGYGLYAINGEYGVFIRRYNGIGNIVTTDIPSSQFNIDKLDGTGPSGFEINHANGNIYEISWIYFGHGPITFTIKAPDDSWVPFHRIEYPNTDPDTSISIPYIPVRAEIDNTGSGKAIELKLGSFSAGVYTGTGRDTTRRPRGFNLGAVPSTPLPSTFPKANANLNYIVAFRSAETLGSRKNKIASLLNFVSIVLDGAQSATLELIFNPTVLTSGTWTQVQTNSPVEYTIDTEFDLDTGEASGLVIPIAKAGDRFVPVADLDSLLRRTEIAAFKVVVPSGNATITQFAIGYFDLF